MWNSLTTFIKLNKSIVLTQAQRACKVFIEGHKFMKDATSPHFFSKEKCILTMHNSIRY
jgi:hypothetical protein